MFERLPRLAGTLLVAALAGALFQRLGSPLPWMLGAAWALLMGHLFGRRLLRCMAAGGGKGVDAGTAYFASVIGGASEMAVFAERMGARVDLVAAAHSLRVMVVVVTLPFAYQFAGLHGSEPAPALGVGFEPAGFVWLALATAAGSLLMLWLRQPNPWVLGSLAVSLALTASGHALSSLPPGLSQAAQLAIGVSLGTRFTPAFLHTAPRWARSWPRRSFPAWLRGVPDCRRPRCCWAIHRAASPRCA